MSRIGKIIAESNCGFKVVINNGAFYYKWLSYKPQFLTDYISTIMNKNSLNSEEIADLIKFREEEYILGELEKYFNGENYNYDDVTEFISNHSLKSIIYSRLTTEEIKKAKDISDKYVSYDSNVDFNHLLDQNKKEEWILNYSGSMVELYGAMIGKGKLCAMDDYAYTMDVAHVTNPSVYYSMCIHEYEMRKCKKKGY